MRRIGQKYTNSTSSVTKIPTHLHREFMISYEDWCCSGVLVGVVDRTRMRTFGNFWNPKDWPGNNSISLRSFGQCSTKWLKWMVQAHWMIIYSHSANHDDQFCRRPIFWPPSNCTRKCEGLMRVNRSRSPIRSSLSSQNDLQPPPKYCLSVFFLVSW